MSRPSPGRDLRRPGAQAGEAPAARSVWPLALLLLLLGMATGACTPAIGDPCASSLECPESSTCDTSAVNGYCLSYDCEYGGCPDASVCVRFDTFTACMASCAVDGDCRTAEGFVCRDDLDPAPFCFHPDSAP